MDDTALADLQHDNMIVSAVAVGSHVPGSLIQRANGIALVATGLPLRLFNVVCIDGDEATGGDLFDGVATIRARDDLFVVNLRAGRDDRFVGGLLEMGLVPISERPWMPGMAAEPIGGIRPPRIEDFEVRRIVDVGGFEDHITATALGFELPVATVRTIVRPAMLAWPGLTFYAGYVEGRPVTSGLGIRTGPTIGIYDISTARSHRRRGLGAAMTARIVADGQAEGCTVAVLQASDMGFTTYERLGFRTVVEYNGYVDPASLDSIGRP